MNPMISMLMSAWSASAPSGYFTFDLGNGSNTSRSNSITNPNNAAMTITPLADWDAGGFSISITPVVIPANSSANLTVNWPGGVQGFDTTAHSTVTWSVPGGGGGTFRITAIHHSNL